MHKYIALKEETMENRISENDRNLIIDNIIELMDREEDLQKHKLILDELYNENKMLKKLLSVDDEITLIVKKIEEITSDIDREKGQLGLEIIQRKEELKKYKYFFEMKESIFQYYLDIFRYVLGDE